METFDIRDDTTGDFNQEMKRAFGVHWATKIKHLKSMLRCRSTEWSHCARYDGPQFVIKPGADIMLGSMAMAAALELKASQTAHQGVYGEVQSERQNCMGEVCGSRNSG